MPVAHHLPQARFDVQERGRQPAVALARVLPVIDLRTALLDERIDGLESRRADRRAGASPTRGRRSVNVNSEIFPEISLDRINIQVPYLGAAPDEVERAVCVRIEEAIQGLDGIKQLTSTAAEGMGSVMVELELGADIRSVLDDIKGRVDAIDTFPEETEKPIVQELLARRQVSDLALSGNADEFALKAAAERVRDELSAIPEISQVEVTSARPYEISIEVSEAVLRRHGLTFDDVASAIRRSSLDLPGGSVRTDNGEILLRTLGQAYRGEEYENLVLLSRADGTRLLVGDVATVIDGFAETDQVARFDVEPTVLLSVFRTGIRAPSRSRARSTNMWSALSRRCPRGSRSRSGKTGPR